MADAWDGKNFDKSKNEWTEKYTYQDPENDDLGVLIDCVKIIAELTPEEEVKKSKTGMIVGISSGVLLVAVIGFFVYKKKKDSTFA